MDARFLVSLIVIAVVALAACREPAQSGFQPAAPAAATTGATGGREGYDLIPKVYDVPPGRETEIRRLLANMSYPVSVVTANGAQTQFVHPQVSFTSDRHLVMTAPVQYHPAIEAVIKQLSAAPAAPSSYEVTYWIVRAEAAGKTTIASELNEIATVFDGLSALGTRSYTMIEHLSARTTDGNRAVLGGQIATVTQELTSMPTAVDLDIELQIRPPGAGAPGMLETTLQLKPDVPVVLGDSAATVTNLNAPAALLLYVVRVRVTP
jgi:hypothetical protein